MASYFHFKIQNDNANAGSILLTQKGCQNYQTELNQANEALNFKQQNLICAKVNLKNPPIELEKGIVIANPEDIDTANTDYIQFITVENLLSITCYKRAIELQKQIDGLPFCPPRALIRPLADDIEDALSLSDISGMVYDMLMYQLFLRDEELMHTEYDCNFTDNER